MISFLHINAKVASVLNRCPSRLTFKPSQTTTHECRGKAFLKRIITICYCQLSSVHGAVKARLHRRFLRRFLWRFQISGDFLAICRHKIAAISNMLFKHAFQNLIKYSTNENVHEISKFNLLTTT